MVWVDGLESIFWGEFWLIFEGIEMGDSMNIDQSLDDIIQSSRTVIRTEGGSGGGGSGYGGDGRKPMYSSRVNRTIYKPSGRRAGGYMDTDRGRWQHDKYRPVLKQPYGRTGTYSKPMSQSSGAKIVVSNLDPGVSNGDISVGFFMHNRPPDEDGTRSFRLSDHHPLSWHLSFLHEQRYALCRL